VGKKEGGIHFGEVAFLEKEGHWWEEKGLLICVNSDIGGKHISWGEGGNLVVNKRKRKSEFQS